MFWSILRPCIKAVNIMCAMLLAGMYVFTYYDYLHTITLNGSVDISGGTPQYSNGQLGVVITREQVNVSQ